MAESRPDVRRRPQTAADPLTTLLAVTATLTAAAAVLVVASVVGRAGTASGSAGALTHWGLPLAKLGLDVAAVGTIGLLLLGGFFLPADGDRLTPTARSAIRTAAWWALAWAGAAALIGVLTISDLAGQPVSNVLTWPAVREFAVGQAQGRALVLVLALALALAVCAARTRTAGDAWLLLVLAAVTVVPPALTGHAAEAVAHDLAQLSLVLHVLAASAWVGGLGALVLHGPFLRATAGRRAGTGAGGRAEPRVSAVVVTGRYSQLALGCFVAVGVSGVVNAGIRLGSWPDAVTELWQSRYGWLVLGKIAAFVALGAFGLRHRTRTLTALAAGRSGAFRRLAVAELVLMALTVALAVALSRSPTPVPLHGGPVAPTATSATRSSS
jgi:putative copper resistance protein D